MVGAKERYHEQKLFAKWRIKMWTLRIWAQPKLSPEKEQEFYDLPFNLTS